MATTTKLEKSSLEAHVDLCAIRYGNLDKRLTTIERKMGMIQTTIEKSHMNMVKVMIGTAGTIVTGMVSTLLVIITKVH